MTAKNPSPSIAPIQPDKTLSASISGESSNVRRLREIFDIAADSNILVSDARERVSVKGERSSVLYREFDSSKKLKALYRVWHQTSAKAPFRRQTGWEKLSPAGELLDREMHFDESSPDIDLH